MTTQRTEKYILEPRLINLHEVDTSELIDDKHNRPAAEFASSREFEGDTQRGIASSTASFVADLSTGITHKLPIAVELSNKSINQQGQ